MRIFTGTLDVMVLSVIHCDGIDTIYRITDRLKELNYETPRRLVSTTLERLRARELVVSTKIPMKPGQRGHPMYSFKLTEQGEKALADQQRVFLEVWGMLLKIDTESGKVLLKIDPDLRLPPPRGRRKHVESKKKR